MKDKNIDFCFKGDRTYVHGTDIYNKIVELLNGKMLNEKFNLSFHGIARKNILLTPDKPKEENQIKFACKYTNQNKQKETLYGIENNKEINCRYAYPEQSICDLSKLNLAKQEAILEKKSSFSFVENSVAINKYLLENLFPNIDGKWYFTRFQLTNIPLGETYPLKLVLKANFNFKLTKTEISIDNSSVGFIYFSLV